MPFALRPAQILHVHLGGQVIRTTGEHPFYAYDRDWVPAAGLIAGDRDTGWPGNG